MCSVVIENVPTEVTVGFLQTCYPKCYMIVFDRERSEPTETAGRHALIRFESHGEAVQEMNEGTIKLHNFSVMSRCDPKPKVVTKCSCLLDIFQSKFCEQLFGTRPAHVDIEKTSQKNAKQEKHIMRLKAMDATSSAVHSQSTKISAKYDRPDLLYCSINGKLPCSSRWGSGCIPFQSAAEGVPLRWGTNGVSATYPADMVGKYAPEQSGVSQQSCRGTGQVPRRSRRADKYYVQPSSNKGGKYAALRPFVGRRDDSQEASGLDNPLQSSASGNAMLQYPFNPLQSSASGNAMLQYPFNPLQSSASGNAMLQYPFNPLQSSAAGNAMLQQLYSPLQLHVAGIRCVHPVPVLSGKGLALQPYVGSGPYQPQQLFHGMHRPMHPVPLPPQPPQPQPQQLFHGMHRPMHPTPLPPQPRQAQQLFHEMGKSVFPSPLSSQPPEPQLMFDGVHKPVYPTRSPPQPDEGRMSNAPLGTEQPPIPIQNYQSSHHTGHQATAAVQQPEMTDMSAYLPSDLFSDFEELALFEPSDSNAFPSIHKDHMSMANVSLAF